MQDVQIKKEVEKLTKKSSEKEEKKEEKDMGYKQHNLEELQTMFDKV